MNSLSRVFLLAGVLVIAPSTEAANIVANAGFESVYASWTFGSWFVCSGGFGAHSGTSFACNGQLTPTTLSQALVTDPGTSYDLSFWLGQVNGAGSSDNHYVAVTWAGALVYDSRNDTLANFQNHWVQISIPALQATTSTTVLAFTGLNVPSNWDLDDVSVSPSAPASSAPEPNTLALCFVGAATVLSRIRRGASPNNHH